MARRLDVVAILKLFRFPLVFTAIADSATGRLLLSGDLRTAAPTLGLLALASAGLYFFGMSLNDLADRDRDRTIAPGRVLPSGRLGLVAARAASFGALALSLVAVTLIRESPLPQRLAAWGVVVFFICAYNLFLKDPPVMGLVRAANLLLGVFAVIDLRAARTALPYVFGIALPAFIYVSALTFVSTQEDGAVNRRHVAVGAAFMVLGAVFAAFVGPMSEHLRFFNSNSAAVIFGSGSPRWIAAPFSAVLAAWIVYRASKAADKKGVMLLVRDGVGGIILLDAALLASYEIVPAFLIAGLVLPAILSVAVFKKLA
jgi:4-hydroxybenzoate polyprenyltransferase